jgi:hypothetical protein
VRPPRGSRAPLRPVADRSQGAQQRAAVFGEAISVRGPGLDDPRLAEFADAAIQHARRHAAATSAEGSESQAVLADLPQNPKHPPSTQELEHGRQRAAGSGTACTLASSRRRHGSDLSRRFSSARATEAVAKERSLVYGENAASPLSTRDPRSRRRQARESARLRGRPYGESPRGSRQGCGSFRPTAGRRG